MHILKRRSPHSARLERWLGKDRLDMFSGYLRNGGGKGHRWYGDPIHLLDVPGGIRVTPDGDFIGQFDRGFFMSAADAIAERLRHLWEKGGRPVYLREAVFGAGFPSIDSLLVRSSSGYSQRLNGMIQKTGPTGVVGVASTLWRLGAMPAAGGAGSAAPGGRALTKATTGAMAFNNVSPDTLHLTGADFSSSIINNSLILYDRLFDVAKTMNSAAIEAVTGTPSRYQSSTPGAPDYSGNNFLFIEVVTALPATAHNWTVCQYTDQDGNTGVSLPSVTGNSSAIIDRFDMPVSAWFCPLASGDTGIKALTQMQCSAIVATGAINFVIGHPIGMMAFPVINSVFPFDWITSREQLPRIFDDAALALAEMPKPATTATSYSGMLYATQAPA